MAVSVSDIDGAISSVVYQLESSLDQTTWTPITGSSGTASSGSFTASYMIPDDQTLVGQYLRINLTSTDALGGTSSYVGTSDQKVANVNDAPVFASATGTGSVAENAAISTVIYTAFATDEDNDTLTYSVSGNDASSITIDASTGAVTLNSSADYETKSSYSFTVTATDGDGATDTQAVTVSVTDVNEAPVFSGDLSGTGAEDGGSITGTLVATDQDGLTDGTLYTLTTVATSGVASIDTVSGAWAYTPNENFNGTDSFVVTLTDDLGNTATQTIALTVTPVDDEATWTVTPDGTFAEGARVSVAVSVSDIDGAISSVVYQLESSLDQTTWTPITGSSGTASSGSFTASYM